MATDDNADNFFEPVDGDLPDTWAEQKGKLDDIIVAERSMSVDESMDAMARRLLNENVAKAVLQLVHVSQHGTNERIRVDASKYIVERVLGKVGDDAFVEDPLTAFITGVTEYVNTAAKQ